VALYSTVCGSFLHGFCLAPQLAKRKGDVQDVQATSSQARWLSCRTRGIEGKELCQNGSHTRLRRGHGAYDGLVEVAIIPGNHSDQLRG